MEQLKRAEQHLYIIRVFYGKNFYVGTPTGYLMDADQLSRAIKQINRKLPAFVVNIAINEQPLDGDSSESSIDIYTKFRPAKVKGKMVRKFDLSEDDQKQARQFVDQVIMALVLAKN